MNPPGISHNLLASAAGRRAVKAARRLVLVQCASCLAKASAERTGFGRLTVVGLPSRLEHGRWSHVGCGGRLEVFDITDEGNA